MPDAAANVIWLEMRRAGNPARSRRIAKAAAVFALCLLGLIGSFADSAVARTGLLLVGRRRCGDPDNLAATLIWATVANLAACCRRGDGGVLADLASERAGRRAAFAAARALSRRL